MEDRASGRMHMIPAVVAALGRTAGNAMVLGYALTVLALNPIWVEVIAKPLKAGSIVWELLLEVFQSEREHFGLAVVVAHGVTYLQVKPYTQSLHTVKG